MAYPINNGANNGTSCPINNGRKLSDDLDSDFGLSSSPSMATKAMFDREVCPMRKWEKVQFYQYFDLKFA